MIRSTSVLALAAALMAAPAALQAQQAGAATGVLVQPGAAAEGTAQDGGQGSAQGQGGSVDQQAIDQAVGQALGQVQQGQDQTGQDQAGQDQTGQDTGDEGADSQSGPQTGFVAPDGALGDSSAATTPDEPQGPEKVTEAPGAVVRWLDKVSGQTANITLKNGQSATKGRLTITLKQCRYPVEDPSSNAYAFLTIHDSKVAAPIFKGWMIASSPALDPLDSPRYDVWLLHCTTS